MKGTWSKNYNNHESLASTNLWSAGESEACGIGVGVGGKEVQIPVLFFEQQGHMCNYRNIKKLKQNSR